MSSPHRIVLIGATGYTGRLVARELARTEAPFVLAARDPAKLRALTEALDPPAAAHRSATVDVTRPDALDRLLRPGDVVINTAGPFSRLGDPVVRACLRTGAHYLDTTGEQAWMHRVHERHDAEARAAGVAIVNAMAFEYALGDCAVAVAATGLERPLRSVDVIYAWGGAAASAGTRRTAIGIMGTRALVREGGRLRRRLTASRGRTVRLASGRTLRAVTFGAGEVLTVPRHEEVETVRGWLVLGRRLARVAPLLAPALPVLVPVLRPLLERLAARGPDPTATERAESGFTIRVEVVGRDGGQRALEVRGRDPYGLTATIAVRGALRALRGDAAGVLAPAQLLPPGALLEGLAEQGVELAPG